MSGPAQEPDEPARLVGADRVLAVLAELAARPEGATLEDLAQRVQSPKPTVHRALSALKRARFAQQTGRGVYLLGDEFIRLALRHERSRPETTVIEPALRRLTDRYGETTHFAVLEGAEVVYRAKVDPPEGGIRLTSSVGGRNPAYRTAVGKLLLAWNLPDRDALEQRLGTGPWEARTPHTITDLDRLWEDLQATRRRGYAIDDQENELGVNCIAVPVRFDRSPQRAGGRQLAGAVSVSALAFRFPIDRLLAEVSTVQSIVDEAVGMA